MAGMSAHTFLWHDYETFGANPRIDRPAQFAAIRTDADLNEIGEPMEWYCLPTPDYVPDPKSCLITGITPQTCVSKGGLPEPEFARRIEAAMAEAGTVGVGYNSLRFDDEFTRFMLWRNLRDPYAREWQNQCGRWDLLEVVRLVFALRPEGTVWPKKPDGTHSLKLEDLARANGIGHESAHDALSDVRATIGLARHIKQVQPKLFDYALGLRNKAQVTQALRWPITPSQAQAFIYVAAGFGVAQGYMGVVWPLAVHPTNKNEVIVWDLRHDPRQLLDMDTATLKRRWFGKKTELQDGETRLPLHTLAINKSPMVVHSLKVLSAAQAQRWQIDMDRVHDHAQIAQALPDLSGVFAQVLLRPVSPSADVEQDLYGGFVADADRRTLVQLLEQPPTSAMWQNATFRDDRLNDLVFRFRARHFPDSLNAAEQSAWQRHCSARLLHGQGGVRTAQQLFDELDELMQAAENEGDEKRMAVLDALYDYGQAIAPDWSEEA